MVAIEVGLAGGRELRLRHAVGSLKIFAVGDVGVVIGFQLSVGAVVGDASGYVDYLAAIAGLERGSCDGEQRQGEQKV